MGENSVLVEELQNFAGIHIVLYTKIAATINPPTPKNLARLAIESARNADPGRDGISYLIAAKHHGIKTGLSSDYEATILERTGCDTLEEALEWSKKQ